jgi:hypothetical protein
LPRGQQHALRSALFRGSEAADARLKLIEHRYDVKWSNIKRDGQLFFRDRISENGKWKSLSATIFLDALEYIDIARPAGEESDAASPPPGAAAAEASA